MIFRIAEDPGASLFQRSAPSTRWKPKRRRLIVLLAVIASTGCRLFSHNPSAPSAVNSGVDLTGPAGRAVFMEAGWSNATKLRVSDEGWEDSSYITRDGRSILFFYHPAHDIFTNPGQAEAIQLDGRLYITQRPFTTKTVYPVSTPDPTTEGSAYVSAGGVLYWVRFPHSNQPRRIVRNGVVLDLGTGGPEDNPHYCDARDELYFDNTNVLGVYKNGGATALPSPINLPGQRSFCPFLTDDCQTIYFTSTRAGGTMQIYRSSRQGDVQWSAPELFIGHPDGISEFTMTNDGLQAVFIELTRFPGGVTTDIYYAARR